MIRPAIFLCLALFLVLPLTSPQHADAQEIATEAEIAPAPIGTIAEIEGNVTIEHNGAYGPAQIGREIYLNDIIETGADSRALLLFIDDTELTLGENARSTVDEYVFDVDTPETNKGRFSVLRGAFIFATGLIDKNKDPDVEIETPYGSIGIRGTVVWGGTMEDEFEDEYNVFVQDGAVTFANERGRVRIDAGQGTKVRSRNAIPQRAVKWEEAKINRATRTVGLKDAATARQRVAAMKEKHTDMRERHRAVIRNRNQRHQDLKQEQHRQRQDRRIENRREHRPEHRPERHEVQPENRSGQWEVKPEARPERPEVSPEKRSEQIRNRPAQQVQQPAQRTGRQQSRPHRAND